MTAPDVRTAAQAEAEQRWMRDAGKPWRRIFVDGAVWGAALVTPTREQIAEVLAASYEPECAGVLNVDLAAADAVLALLLQVREVPTCSADQPVPLRAT